MADRNAVFADCANERYRASGLNLILAAIILWNTVYLGLSPAYREGR